MSFSSSTVWEVRSSGSSTAGGGFDVGSANLPADLAATSATTTSPVVTSASYSFQAGDVGSYVFVRSGTNWVPGFYPIASVSGGAATLNAAIGAVVLYGGATNLNTTAGCATVSSPTAAVFGCDYSQQNSARLSYTDMAIDGTTSTKFTSAANPCGVNLIGNVINVTGGTGFTVQRVQVVSVSGTTATADKSLGTLSSAGGAGNLGGALGDLPTLGGLMVAGNKAFVGGSFTQSATATFSAGSFTASPSSPPCRIVGYGSIRGDGGRATITLSTNSGLIAVSLSNSSWAVENLSIDCASLSNSIGVKLPAFSRISNCKVANFTNLGIWGPASQSAIVACELTGGTSAAQASVSVPSISLIYGCNAHANACPGIWVTGSGTAVVRNLVASQSGASSDGILWSDGLNSGWVLANTVYGSGRDGIRLGTSSGPSPLAVVQGNLLAGNGGYGLNLGPAGWAAESDRDGNAYYGNTSGPRNAADDVGGTNKVDGVCPYVNALDVTLTADPFVNAAGGNFALNNNAGGGAACRGHGVPASWPGNSATAGYPDLGAVQSQSTTYVFSTES